VSAAGPGPAPVPAASVRVAPYGADALLVDLPGLAAVRALDDALRADPLGGAVDVVPAARTLLVRFDDGSHASAAADDLAVRAGRAAADPASARTPTEPVVLPVRYDGADLAEVARRSGLAEAEVVRRHAAATYTVAFGGFMPGFAYLTGLDPALHLPRLPSPRERVPAGAVAVAGEFTAVYPAATPGGWLLLGTCDVPLFHVDRDPPALLRPGTRVRFSPVDDAVPAAAPAPVAPAAPAPLAPPAAPTVEVLAPGALTLVQDTGRPGLAAVGVGRSGAADAGALRLANRLVGNAADAAALEVLLGGVELRFPAGGVVALAGAEVPAWVGGDPLAPHAATRIPPGGVLRTGLATRGLRLVVGVRGGIDVPPVLGSRSADQLSGLGPAPLRSGDVLPVGTRLLAAAQPWPDPPRPWTDPVVLRLLPGPRADWFAPDALDRLRGVAYTVTPASNRVAVRLDGPPVQRVDRGELPSEPLVPGAVQVPPDGQPVVFGPDHPVTGGYPVLAVLDARSRDRAAQLRPGDRVVLAPPDLPAR
jgi:KipI family sensor histidine kinase inhibitor